MFRGFISADIGAQDGIVEFSRALSRADPSLKVVDPALAHLTLKFLGDTREDLVPLIQREMERAVEGVSPMRMVVKGAGAFPGGSRVRVVWVAVEGASEMVTIAGRLDEELSLLGFERENREFKPHITVARSRNDRPSEALKRLIQEYRDHFFAELTVGSIKLKKSVLSPKGPTYSTVAEFFLD